MFQVRVFHRETTKYHNKSVVFRTLHTYVRSYPCLISYYVYTRGKMVKQLLVVKFFLMHFEDLHPNYSKTPINATSNSATP